MRTLEKFNNAYTKLIKEQVEQEELNPIQPSDIDLLSKLGFKKQKLNSTEVSRWLKPIGPLHVAVEKDLKIDGAWDIYITDAFNKSGIEYFPPEDNGNLILTTPDLLPDEDKFEGWTIATKSEMMNLKKVIEIAAENIEKMKRNYRKYLSNYDRLPKVAYQAAVKFLNEVRQTI